jgi:hypothetical protein
MVATGFAGAFALVLGASAFLPGRSHFNVIELISNPKETHCTQWQCYAVSIGWVLFGVLGVSAQALTHYIFTTPHLEEPVGKPVRFAKFQDGDEEHGSRERRPSGGRHHHSGHSGWEGRRGSQPRSLRTHRPSRVVPMARRSRRMSYEELEEENALLLELARKLSAKQLLR